MSDEQMQAAFEAWKEENKERGTSADYEWGLFLAGAAWQREQDAQKCIRLSKRTVSQIRGNAYLYIARTIRKGDAA